MNKTFFEYSVSLFIKDQQITIDDIANKFLDFNKYGLLPSTFQVTDIVTGQNIFFPQLSSSDKKWQVNITDHRIDVEYKPVDNFVINQDECDNFISKSNNILDIFFKQFNIKVHRIAFNSSFFVNKEIDFKKYIVENSMNEKPIEWKIRHVFIKQLDHEQINVIQEISVAENASIPIGNSIKVLNGALYHFDINTRQTNTKSRFNLDNYKLIIEELKSIRKDKLDKVLE